MKKFVVRCDLEGASGIVCYEQAEPWQSEYADGRRYFMSDLIALLRGLDDGGADVIQVYDEHCYGRNVILDQIPGDLKAKVTFFCGKPDYTKTWAGGLDRDTDGLIMLGFHSKAHSLTGDREALLQHSYDKNLSEIWINGLSVGEIGMETAIAGCFDVPLVMAVGDSEGMNEAKALVPEVNTVTVKESCSGYGGECLPIAKTYQMIYETAKATAQKCPDAKPLKFASPTKVEIEFYPADYGRKYELAFGKASFTGEDPLDCWAQFQAKKARVDAL